MTTLPPNYLRLSSKWLETNVAPEDLMLITKSRPDSQWHPSVSAGFIITPENLKQFHYATARTDLPREAYADDEIRPMTHEERKALDEFTMKELTESEPAPDLTQSELPKAGLTQPLSEIGEEQWEGAPDNEPCAEVASERAEETEIQQVRRLARECIESMIRFNREADRIHCALVEGRFVEKDKELATLRAQLDVYRTALQRISDNRSKLSSEDIEAYRDSGNSGDIITAGMAQESNFCADIADKALKS